MNNNFSENKYVIRRKVMTVGGAKFHIYNETGGLMFYCKQKAFKMKEDIRLYTDESMSVEVLVMQARSVIDFSATYDVFDTAEGVKIGALQRKGMKSILKDEWIVLDAYDNQLGLIQEDSAGLAFVRRFLANIIPQNFDMIINGKKVVDLKQDFNPFIYKLNIDYTFDTENVVDRRLGIAAGLLIATIEGRQK